jgi:thiamine-monophosphate kinase
MRRGIGEFELIGRIRRQTVDGGRVRLGIGDDAAVTSASGLTVTTVDSVVEGVHFDRAFCGPEAIAHKALATALSDIAAMAADPGEVYVSVGLPGGLAAEFAEGLADGLVDCARRWGVALAGGDTVSSPTLFLAVTAVGHVPEGEEPLTRSGASPGDLVAVTGSLGGAGAGLVLLREPSAAMTVDAGTREVLVARQLRPEPLLECGMSLRASGVGALIDVSDGLGADLGHVAGASGVAIEIEADSVPVQDGVADVARGAGLDPLDLALAAGEDYELAMTIPPGRLPAVAAILDRRSCTLEVIGKVTEGTGVRLLRDGLESPMPEGFQHLR